MSSRKVTVMSSIQEGSDVTLSISSVRSHVSDVPHHEGSDVTKVSSPSKKISSEKQVHVVSQIVEECDVTCVKIVEQTQVESHDESDVTPIEPLQEIPPYRGSVVTTPNGNSKPDIADAKIESPKRAESDSDDEMFDSEQLRLRIQMATAAGKLRSARRTVSESDSQPRPERCDLCGKSFRTSVQLRRHVMVHRKQKSLDLPARSLSESAQRCDICQKLFENAAFLKKHKLRRHSSKDTKCDVCGEQFESKPVRDNHRRTHFGENPFSCHII